MPRSRVKINWFLRLLYSFLRITARIGIYVFFRRRAVLDRQNFQFEGPAIVVVNHPSTLMDVLNPGINVPHIMFFLANWGLFKHPVSNWILRRLYCIPVKRSTDVGEGENRDLEDTFEQSYRHLEQNGILFIAPEGYSWMTRYMYPIKTGTARIAFGTESRNNWQTDLKIIPIGQSYSAPHLFRSNTVVRAGKPVYPREWRSTWEQDPVAAVEALTQHLQETLQALSIHTRDDAGETFITRVETVLQHEKPLPLKDDFLRTQALIERHLDNATLRSAAENYFQALDERGVSDYGVAIQARPGAFAHTVRDAFLLALFAPFVIPSYLFWLIPCYLPWLLNKKMDLYVGYSSTVKFLAALFVFPLAFWGFYRLFLSFLPSPLHALALLALFILSGFLLESYLDIYRRFAERLKASRLDPATLGELDTMRRNIASMAG